jgi:hypothetical protein
MSKQAISEIDPRHHTQNVRKIINNLITRLRDDITEIDGL